MCGNVARTATQANDPTNGTKAIIGSSGGRGRMSTEVQSEPKRMRWWSGPALVIVTMFLLWRSFVSYGGWEWNQTFAVVPLFLGGLMIWRWRRQ